MTDKCCRIYLRTERPFDLVHLSRILDGGGVRLRNPQNDLITQVDSWGNPYQSSAEKIQQSLASRQKTNFQFWLDDQSSDLFCSVSERSEGLRLLYFGLDGIGSHREWLPKLLLDLFRTYAMSGQALGMMLDTMGWGENIDWEAFVLQGDGAPDYWPEILSLRKEVVGRVEHLLSSYNRERCGDLRIFERYDAGADQ